MTPANLLIKKALKGIATLGWVGFAPFAPGTLGTLLAVPLVWLLNLPRPLYAAMAVAVTALGTVASDAAAAVLGEKDPQCVVVDEFAGYLIAAAFLPKTPGYLLSAFILFRLFDILKPMPISSLQGLRGGYGIMADDIAAGVLANVILQAWNLWIRTS